ncbi:esterase/lipase family protein [Oscillatoria salina]|uniref:esterase/lipase family protein n=1 Tax=Oscillatoria salina TaxID=331517 RepID=UPI0013BB70D6|nr:triacylglycerol lipase [Oscillatoria salina]MBZ8179803.1 triacylglycerol lipase [Oscillatoria salina IIICB1]NET87686.1 triacylglycerol lipase [Kamptonema sp. SIO1D9]
MNKTSHRHPTILIHGIHDTNSVFDRMSASLIEQGWSVHSLDLIPNNGFASIEQLARQLAEYISEVFPPEQPLDLIGFSMGGIVTRYYLQRLGGIKRIQRYISISAPNNGTLTGYALPFPGIMQMRPASNFLADLNSDVEEKLSQINCTWIWTPYDLMILPPNSSQMPVGKQIQLPVLMHSWMLKDPQVIATVTAALKEPTNKKLPRSIQVRSPNIV